MLHDKHLAYVKDGAASNLKVIFALKITRKIKWIWDRPDCPNKVTTSDMIEKYHDIVIHDRRIKIREIAQAMGISNEQVQNILRTHLDRAK